MKKWLSWLTQLLCLLLLFAGSASAQVTDNIKNTKHNFNLGGTTNGRTAGVTLPGTFTSYGEVCVYCHTPHGGRDDTPLWNRALANPQIGTTYQMYSSPTIDQTVDAAPTGISLACLGCHDGTIGIDVVTNPPNTFTGALPVAGTKMGDLTALAGFNSYANFSDRDLRNDHPISMVYPVSGSGDQAFNFAVGSRVNNELPLYSGKVQCASCHNPHEAAVAKQPFLRKSNLGSQLCLTCHIK